MRLRYSPSPGAKQTSYRSFPKACLIVSSPCSPSQLILTSSPTILRIWWQMKLCPTRVNRTKLIRCSLRSSSLGNLSCRQRSITSSSTISARMDIMQRSHRGSVCLQPLVKLWKWWVPRYRLQRLLSLPSSSSRSSSSRTRSCWSLCRKSRMGAMQLQTREAASWRMSKPLPTRFMVKMRMSKGSSALMSLVAFSRSTALVWRLMMQRSSNYRLADMPLQRA